VDHAARNRVIWDAWSPAWVESGRRGWAQAEIEWPSEEIWRVRKLR
jgi:hypothetical protein